MKTKLSILMILTLAALGAACESSDQVTNSNANANTAVATTSPATTAPANDVTTTVDASGTKTETKVYHNNPRVAKVVVTTKNGVKTTKVYTPSGEEKELKGNDAENVFEKTGDAIADSAGVVADKTKDVASDTKNATEKAADKTVDKSKEVGAKAVDTTKTVGTKTAEGAKKVGSATVEGAKTVGTKTAEGAKKAGSAVKKVIP